jgi:hypothetical protein
MRKKLTKQEKSCILVWLAHNKGDTERAKCDCPFVRIDYGYDDRCMVTCGSFFKQITEQLRAKVRILKCPCYAYPIKYVRKQARKWVKG